MTAETNTLSQPSFKASIQKYVNYLLKQYSYIPTVYEFLCNKSNSANKAYKKFLREKALHSGFSEETVSSENSLLVPSEILQELNIKEGTAKAFDFISERLFETQFVDCITTFDVFLMSLFRSIFAICPDILNSSGKTITYKELQALDSVERARKLIEDDIIDTTFRGSHKSQLEYLKCTFHIDIIAWAPNLFSKFIELTERRNALIHCDGIASSQYVSVCKQCGVENIAAEGTRLIIDKYYFKNSCLTLLELALTIGYASWKKYSNDDRADEYLINSCDALCREGHYELVVSLVSFALNKLKKKPNNLNIHHMTAYQIYAFKRLGREDEKNQLLKGDWSSVGLSVEIILDILKEDFSSAVDKVKRNGKNLDDAKRYTSMDIYSDLIKEQSFLDAYKEIYGEDFRCRREEYIRES